MSSPVQYLQKMLEKAGIHQKKEKFSDRLLKHSAFGVQTNNKPAVSSQQQLGSMEAPENKPLTSAPITQNKPITQPLTQKPVQITGANQTHKAYSNPIRSSSPPKPPSPATTTKIPRPFSKIAYKRNTGLADSDGLPYTNTDDVILLNKLGYTIDENSYMFLPRGEEREGLYTYIEKNAGIPKSVTQCIDEGTAFSGEYLKDMDYEIPKGYEIKGDLCCPVEKTAFELNKSPEKTASVKTFYHGSPTAGIKELEPKLDPRLNLMGAFVADSPYAPELFSLMPERHKAIINTVIDNGKFISGEVTVPHENWLNEKGYLYEFDNPKSLKERAKDRYMLTEKTIPNRVKEVLLKDVLARGWKIKVKDKEINKTASDIYNNIVIENPKGSKKEFGKNYPIPVMTYPVDYGYLPGYTAQDDADLDFFKGTAQKDGLHGSFDVWRPDVKGELETKFYTGATEPERDQILKAFQKVIRGTPKSYISNDLMEAIKHFAVNKDVEKTAAADPSQTILITGHSGSGKSTLGKLLAEKLNLPLQRVDAQESWDNLRADLENRPDYERKALTPGSIENKKYIRDIRKIVGKSLKEINGPAILEGTQVTTLPNKQLQRYLANIVVGGDVEQSIAQRIQRMTDKAAKKGIVFSPEELEKKKSESRLVADSWHPGIEKFKQLPGVLKYNHTEHQAEPLIKQLQQLMSKKAEATTPKIVQPNPAPQTAPVTPKIVQPNPAPQTAPVINNWNNTGFNINSSKPLALPTLSDGFKHEGEITPRNFLGQVYKNQGAANTEINKATNYALNNNLVPPGRGGAWQPGDGTDNRLDVPVQIYTNPGKGSAMASVKAPPNYATNPDFAGKTLRAFGPDSPHKNMVTVPVVNISDDKALRFGPSAPTGAGDAQKFVADLGQKYTANKNHYLPNVDAKYHNALNNFGDILNNEETAKAIKETGQMPQGFQDSIKQLIPYQNMPGVAPTNNREVLRHEIAHSYNKHQPQRLSPIEGDTGYFKSPQERATGISTIQQDLYNSIGSRAESPEQFKSNISRFLTAPDMERAMDEGGLKDNSKRYLRYLKQSPVQEKVLENDAFIAPAFVQNSTAVPTLKTAEATHELKSSNIKAVGYNKENKSLDVAFHSGGNYTYKDVPKSLFDRIKRVKSPGKFFHKHIKRDNPYSYERIEKESEHQSEPLIAQLQQIMSKKASTLVVSGIHGDEPAGDVAAEKLKGTTDVISNINPTDKRRFRGKDINRHFDKPAEGSIQQKLLDIIDSKRPSRVVALHEDDEVDKPYAYSSPTIAHEVKEALKDKDTATSAHNDKTDDGVISEGKNPPKGSLEKALDNRGIAHATIETPSKSQNMGERTKTHLDVIKSLLGKEAGEKPGLWANIRAKKARGEKAAKPGSEDYPDKKQWDKLTKAAVAAWQRSEGKNPEGGLNAKGRASYKKETGGTLKAPVTESNPSGERAKRQNSFCSRMCGMKRKNTGSEGQSNPDSRINKSLRKWNCKCGEAHESLFEKVACMLKESKGRCWEGYEPVPGKEAYSEDSCRPKGKKKESEIEKEAVDAYELRKLIIDASRGCRDSKQALSIMGSKGKGGKLKSLLEPARKAVGESVQGTFPFDGSHQMEIVKKNIDPSYIVDRSKYLGR